MIVVVDGAIYLYYSIVSPVEWLRNAWDLHPA